MAHSRSGDMRTDSGASRVGCLLGLLLLLLGGYAAIQFAGHEIDYRQLQGEVQTQAAMAAERDDQTIREAIAGRAADLQLPAAAGQALIRRVSGDRIQITVQYSDALDFFGRWQWVLNRRIQIDQTY